MDMKAPDFSMDLDLYKDQLLKDLAVNVLKDGLWGSYRHFPIQVFSNEPVEHAFVNTTVRGDLSSLSWLQGPVAFKSVFILLLAIIAFARTVCSYPIFYQDVTPIQMCITFTY